MNKQSLLAIISVGAYALALALPAHSQQKSSAPAPAPAEQAKSLPYERDAARVDAAEKSRLDIEKSLKGFYGTPSQLERSAADIKVLADITALYKAQGTTPAHRALADKALAQMKRVQSTARSVFASSMEETFMKRGLDIKLSATGSENKTLRVTYILMSQPLVYQFQNEMKLSAMAQGIGFSRVVYANGAGGSLGKTWTVDLAK